MLDFDPESVRVVVGPPGTGKTHHVAEKVAEAARVWGPSKVMVVSMTRTAAAEAGARVGSTSARLPKNCVGTLHSFAYRALGSPKLAEVGDWVKVWNEIHPAFSLCASGSKAEEGAPEERGSAEEGGGNDHLSAYNVRRSMLRGTTGLAQSTLDFVSRWEAFKEENDLLDFEDLIHVAARDCAEAPGSPHIIYGDEAQDWTESEYGLLLRWAKAARGCVVVGDPDQSIYEWRGASATAVSEIWGACERRVLSQSYRVPRAVHAYAMRWLRRGCPKRIESAYEPRDADGEVLAIGSTRRTPAGMVEDIRRELGRGRSCMILAPCSYMLDESVRELRDRGIAFHNPYRPRNGRWNPLGSTKRGKAYLAGRAGSWTFAELWRWIQSVEAKRMVKGSKKWAKRSASDKKLADLSISIEDVAESCFDKSMEWWNPESLGALYDMTLKSERKRLEYQARVVSDGGAAALLEAPRVSIGTIHSAKGGEADTVYLIPEMSNSWRSTIRHPDGVAALTRLFYVGITRARSRLVLLQPTGSESAQLPMPR